jgi:O-antigen ligase
MKLHLKKITEYGFYLLVFLLPLQTRWIWHYGQLGDSKWFDFAAQRGWWWEYGTFSLFGTELLLWAIFIFVAMQNLRKKIEARHPKFETNLKFKIPNLKLISNIKYLIFLFFVYLSLSTYWSLDKGLIVYHIFHLIEALILIYLILKINFNFKRLLQVIMASAFVQACLGIWQFVTQQVVANKWLGIAAQNPMDPGVSVVGTELRRWLRVYGGFSHSNVLAGFLGLGFLIGLYLITNYQVENKKQLYQKLVLIFGNLIILISLLFTFSRSAWASLVIAILFYSYFVFKKYPKGIQNPIGFWIPASKRLVLFLSYSLVIIAVIVFVFKEPFLTRVQGRQRLEQKSVNERQLYYQEAWQLTKKRPWLGVGVGNYTLAVHDLANPDKYMWEYQPVHNVYVLVLVELGVVGFLLLLFLFYKLIKKYRIKNIEFRNNSIILYSLFYILILGLFDHYLWTSYFGVMVLGLMIGLIIKYGTNPSPL